MRLQTIIQQVMLRRMKDSELDGKKLINLKPKTVTLEKLEFMPEERDVYSMVCPTLHFEGA
jgi:SNF2 family DNA or RNA helicase